jgi:DNA-binding transcriptional regulator YdaS (Cro superfamily)
MSDTHEALRRAVELFDNPTRLAAAIGYSQHAVWHALNKRGQVSPQMAIAIHKTTKGKVTKQQLRPDIFGDAA